MIERSNDAQAISSGIDVTKDHSLRSILIKTVNYIIALKGKGIILIDCLID